MQAFPVGSPIVSRLSKAILNITQGPEINAIESKYFGGYKECQAAAESSSQSYGLKAYSFGGLLIVTFGGVLLVVSCMMLADMVAESHLRGLFIDIVKNHFGKRSSNSQANIQTAPSLSKTTSHTSDNSSVVSDDAKTVEAEEHEAYIPQEEIQAAET